MYVRDNWETIYLASFHPNLRFDTTTTIGRQVQMVLLLAQMRIENLPEKKLL
jgi:hypothetical protein